jgi:hypothetical protein
LYGAVKVKVVITVCCLRDCLLRCCLRSFFVHSFPTYKVIGYNFQPTSANLSKRQLQDNHSGMGIVEDIVSNRSAVQGSPSDQNVLTDNQFAHMMGESSQRTEPRSARRPSEDETHHLWSSRQDGRGQSLMSAASTGSVGLGDSGMKKLSSRHSEELHELRYRIDKYRKRNQELETSLMNTEAKFENEQASRRAWMDAYNFIFDRTVQPYANLLGIELSGYLDEHLASVSEDLVSNATESFTLRTKAQEKDLQLHNAQEQLRLLQAEMLARVDNVETVPDEHLAQEFHSLVSCVRVFSRSVRASEGKSILDVLKPRGFLVGVPGHHWEARASKRIYIEAWIWSVLFEEVFGTPLLIFGNSGNIHEESWSMMFGRDHFGGWPRPCSSSETWKYMTTERLLELSNRDIITRGYIQPHDMDTKNPTWCCLVSDIFTQRSNVANILKDNLTALSATADLLQVPKIVNKAFSLALEMLLSRSRVQITYAQTGARFNEKAMSVHDTDDENLDNRTVAFVVRPGMTKWGDAHGKHFEESYDIVRCEVQLEAGSSNGASLDLMDFTTF